MAAGLHRAHHDLAGVDADANLDACAAESAEIVAPAAEIVAGREGGVNRPLRMVLMGDRRAEQREDAVAGRLHDVAVVAMDRADHQLERGIDDRACLFRVEIRHQLGRALDIGKQRSDSLALTLEILGGGNLGYPDLPITRFLCRRGRSRVHRGSAFLAESRPWTHYRLAGRTQQLQLRATLLTECSV